MPLSPEEINAVVAQVWAENPTLAPSRKNAELVAAFLEENHCDLILENVRIAVRALSYPSDRLERRQPPAPAQPVVEPAEPPEEPLPPIPAYMGKLETKSDVLACTRYKEFFFGNHSRQFRARVDEILRRAAAGD